MNFSSQLNHRPLVFLNCISLKLIFLYCELWLPVELDVCWTLDDLALDNEGVVLIEFAGTIIFLWEFVMELRSEILEDLFPLNFLQ